MVGSPVDPGASGDRADGCGHRGRAGTAEVRAARWLESSLFTRPRGAGRYLVTVTLYNGRESDGGLPDPLSCFYQSGFSVESPDGSACFHPYEEGHSGITDDEEAVYDLLYRDRKPFGIGHGCAADWGAAAIGRATTLRTSSLPLVHVPASRAR